MASPLFKSLLVIGMSFTLGVRTAIAEWNLPLHYSFISIFPHLVGQISSLQGHLLRQTTMAPQSSPWTMSSGVASLKRT